jgi:hypothetical protein
MAAPKTDNKAIDDQPVPGAEFKVQLNVGLASFEALSHDPENLGKIIGLMNGEGSWTTSHIDHKGNANEIVHGAKKGAAQASHRDVSGGHDVERVAGGSHSQKKNGSNEENGEHETKAVKGAVQAATESSGKTYSKGGDGNIHHKGDMTTSVEEGGVHFNVSQDYTVTATGKLISLNSSKEINLKAGGNYSQKTSGNTAIDTEGKTRIFSKKDINIVSDSSITLRVGDTVLLLTKKGISLSTLNGQIQMITSGTGNILIDSEGGNVGIAAETGPIILEAGESNHIVSKSGTYIEVDKTAGPGGKPTTYVPALPWNSKLGKPNM